MEYKATGLHHSGATQGSSSPTVENFTACSHPHRRGAHVVLVQHIVGRCIGCPGLTLRRQRGLLRGTRHTFGVQKTLFTTVGGVVIMCNTDITWSMSAVTASVLAKRVTRKMLTDGDFFVCWLDAEPQRFTLLRQGATLLLQRRVGSLVLSKLLFPTCSRK